MPLKHLLSNIPSFHVGGHINTCGAVYSTSGTRSLLLQCMYSFPASTIIPACSTCSGILISAVSCPGQEILLVYASLDTLEQKCCLSAVLLHSATLPGIGISWACAHTHTHTRTKNDCPQKRELCLVAEESQNV